MSEPAEIPASPRPHHWWRRLGRLVAILLTLALLTLLWPGWPLHPLSWLAARQARAQGLQLDVTSPWLRLHLDGTIELTAAAIRVGDTPQPQALAVESIQAQWKLGDLVHARALPAAVAIGRISATLRTDAKGQPLLVQLSKPVAAPRPADASSDAFTPATLPAAVLPGIGRQTRLAIGSIQIQLPEGLPARRLAAGPLTSTLDRPDAQHLALETALPLQVDDRPGSLHLTAQIALVRDWIGQGQLDLTAAPSATTPSTRINLELSRPAASQPVQLGLRIEDCAPGDWLALLGRTDLPAMTGQIALQLEAQGDPIAWRLHSAKLHLATTTCTFAQPDLLAHPLALAPLAVDLQVEDNGTRGTVSPFALQAGPVDLRCPGITWTTSGETVTGTGQLQLGALPLPRLLELLPPALAAKLPLTPAEAAELGLAATTVDLQLAGTPSRGLPRLHLVAHTGLTLNRGQLGLDLIGDFDPTDGAVAARLTIPDFVAARWQLSLLQRLPLPAIEAPIQAEFSVQGRLPATLTEARWRVAAGAGQLIPQGPSLHWLARPFPITAFVLSGRLDEGIQHLEIEQLALTSGRAQLALERTELRSTQSLITSAGQAGATARFHLKMQDWYAADFLSLLGPGLQPVIAPVADDLARIGLEQLDTSFEVAFAQLPWINSKLSTLQGRQSALFRLGEEHLPVEIEWRLAPEAQRVTAQVQLRDLRLDRLRLPSLGKTNLPLETLELPFALELELSANPFAASLELMEAAATVHVATQNGRIKANPWLAADLPVTKFDCAVTAKLLPLALDRFRLEADFGGPTLLIDDARYQVAQGPRGSLHLQLRQMPMDWAYARIPAAYRPPELAGLQLRGAIEQLDLRTAFRAPDEKSLPEPTTLEFSAQVRGLSAQLPKRPEVSLQTLTLAGNLDQLDLKIDRAALPGVALTDFAATVTAPLRPQRHGRASGQLAVDLGQVPALLAANRDLAPTLPRELDLDGLTGQVAVRFTAEAPLDPAALPGALAVQAELTASQVQTPVFPAALTGIAASAQFDRLELSAHYQGVPARTATGLGELKLEAGLHHLRMFPSSRPRLDLQTLTLTGNLDRLELTIDRATTSGVTLSDCAVTVTAPLQLHRQAQATGLLTVDLSQTPALLAVYRDVVPLPPNLDLTGLGGEATVRFSAGAPLDPARLAAELRAHAEIAARQLVFPMIPAGLDLGQSTLRLTTDLTGPTIQSSYTWQPEKLEFAPWIGGTTTIRGTTTITPQSITTHERLDLAYAEISVPELCWSKPRGLPASLEINSVVTPRAGAEAAQVAATIETSGLLCAPLRTKLAATLSDDTHPALGLLPGLAGLQLRETQFGRSSLELEATRADDGATLLVLRSPLIDLSEWVAQLTPAIIRWSQQSATTPTPPSAAPPPTPPAATKRALQSPPATSGLPALPLPPLRADIAVTRLQLDPTHQLENLQLQTELRDGFPRSFSLSAAAGPQASLALQIEPAAPRQPWHFQLTNFAQWLTTLTAPVSLLPESATPPDSPLATLRTLPAAFVGGNLTLAGTLDWRDRVNTIDGRIQVTELTLQQELGFLSRIAALVKKRVILQLPFKVFTVPEFTANPDFVSLRRLTLQGPIDLTSNYLDLDLARSRIDMHGKVIGINFEVAGPLSDPSFYLAEKSPLIQGITTQDDFEW